MSLVVVAAASLLVAWALVDVWRRSDEPTRFKWGWTLLALAGQLSLPGWRLTDGWYAALPLGAIAYLTLAPSGPLRRREHSKNDQTA